MFINGYALDEQAQQAQQANKAPVGGEAGGLLPNVGLRFLGDFLAGLRKYDYQQACPYPNPATGEAVRANCAFNHTGK